jgi:hypothetical protein
LVGGDGDVAATAVDDLGCDRDDQSEAIIRSPGGHRASELGGDPKRPLLVMFHNRRRTHAKLLWHDGHAYCLFYKRLDRGRTFRIPLAIPPDAKSVVVDARELHLILGGLNHKLLRKADAIVAAIRAARKG